MRVRLVPLERKDLEWVLAQRNVPNTYVMFNQPVPISMEHQINWFETQVLTQRAFPYIVYLDNIKVGYVALQNINWITRSAEVSHFIILEVNQDLTVYAHECILSIAFNDLNLNRIHSICFNHNPVFEKLKRFGFKSEGTLRQSCFKEGKLGDSQMIAVLREDWISLQESLKRKNNDDEKN